MSWVAGETRQQALKQLDPHISVDHFFTVRWLPPVHFVSWKLTTKYLRLTPTKTTNQATKKMENKCGTHHSQKAVQQPRVCKNHLLFFDLRRSIPFNHNHHHRREAAMLDCLTSPGFKTFGPWRSFFRLGAVGGSLRVGTQKVILYIYPPWKLTHGYPKNGWFGKGDTFELFQILYIYISIFGMLNCWGVYVPWFNWNINRTGNIEKYTSWKSWNLSCVYSVWIYVHITCYGVGNWCIDTVFLDVQML